MICANVQTYEGHFISKQWTKLFSACVQIPDSQVKIYGPDFVGENAHTISPSI